MDFKEGAEEVAAAQGDHLLWAQDWKLGLGCRVQTKHGCPCKLDLELESDPTALKPHTPNQVEVSLLVLEFPPPH